MSAASTIPDFFAARRKDPSLLYTENALLGRALAAATTRPADLVAVDVIPSAGESSSVVPLRAW